MIVDRNGQPVNPGEVKLVVPSGVKVSGEPLGKIERLWVEFEKPYLQRFPSEVRAVMRKAFFAGAWSLKEFVKKILESTDENTGLAIYQDIHNEIESVVKKWKAKPFWENL